MDGRREQKKSMGVFGQKASSFRTKHVATYPVILLYAYVLSFKINLKICCTRGSLADLARQVSSEVSQNFRETVSHFLTSVILAKITG